MVGIGERAGMGAMAGTGRLGAHVAILWRQRVLLLLALVITAVGLAVGWQWAPEDYHARTTLTWVGDPGVELDDDDLAAVGSRLVRRASRTDVLEDVLARLDLDRSVDQLRSELDVRWDPQAALVSVEVHDEDEDVARSVVQALCERLPADGQELGIDGFRAATSVSVSAHKSAATWVGAALWVLLAGAAALLLASWRDARTNTVSDAAEIETALTAPVLAHVRMPRDPTVMPALTPGAAAAHPFRHVRAALRLAGRRADHVVARADPSDAADVTDRAEVDTPATARVVVSSSPVAGHAPVWVATNLALALVQDGWRVLLVDGRLGSRFGRPGPGEPSGPGLLDVLDGVPLEEAYHPGPVPGLSVVAAGTRRDTIEVLSVARFSDVVVEALRLVDVVIVIAPELDVCDDALVMATPGTLLLSVPEGRVSPAVLRAQGARIRATVPRLLGSVLVGRLTERAIL